MSDNGKRKMTPEEARTFDRESPANAAILEQAAVDRGCSCRPYHDFYTYQRWLAQGMQVQKGEHGVKLGIFIETVEKDKETGEAKVVGKRPWSTSVFCRCQVKPKE